MHTNDVLEQCLKIRIYNPDRLDCTKICSQTFKIIVVSAQQTGINILQTDGSENLYCIEVFKELGKT